MRHYLARFQAWFCSFLFALCYGPIPASLPDAPELLEQSVARLRDASVMVVSAACVGMHSLGQPPEGGI